MSAYEEKDMVITNSEAAEQRPHAKILTINRPCPSRQLSAQLLSTINDVDSTRSLTPPGTATNEKTIETTYTTAINERDLLYADLEAQSLTTQKTQVSASKTGLLNTACSRVDSAWPGRNHMKQQKKEGLDHLCHYPRYPWCRSRNWFRIIAEGRRNYQRWNW